MAKYKLEYIIVAPHDRSPVTISKSMQPCPYVYLHRGAAYATVNILRINGIPVPPQHTETRRNKTTLPILHVRLDVMPEDFELVKVDA